MPNRKHLLPVLIVSHLLITATAVSMIYIDQEKRLDLIEDYLTSPVAYDDQGKYLTFTSPDLRSDDAGFGASLTCLASAKSRPEPRYLPAGTGLEQALIFGASQSMHGTELAFQAAQRICADAQTRAALMPRNLKPN
jgi:hypothetical protein